MHIVFVCYNTYIGCSGVHIHFLASAMTSLGHRCTVCLPFLPEEKTYFGPVNYEMLSYTDAVRLAREGFFHNAMIHGWTPREPIRWLVKRLVHLARLPYFIHLEDNERLIMETQFGKSLPELEKDARARPAVYSDLENIFCHPLEYRPFLEKALGVTCIVDALEEDVPQGLPRMTFWPACEDAFFNIPPKAPEEARAAIGIEPGTTVLVYPGTVHVHNAAIISELALALGILEKEGRRLKIIRSGFETCYLEEKARAVYARHVLHAGEVPARNLPALVGLADILVQPGCPSLYDDYRFPSKVPFFLASGRPLVLPRTNIGKKLSHGENALLLETGSAEEIAEQLRFLMDNPELAARIGRKGRFFARKAFNWEHSAKALLAFYIGVLRDAGRLDCLSKA